MKVSSFIYAILTVICMFTYVILCLTNNIVARCIFCAVMGLLSGLLLVEEIRFKRRISPNDVPNAPKHIASDLTAKSFTDDKDWVWYKHYRERTYEAIEFWKSHYVREKRKMSGYIIYMSGLILFWSVYHLLTAII